MGFFNREQTCSKSRPDGRTYSCASCGLYQDVLSPRMRPYGEFKKRILNVGEAPGETEDKRGRQWQGKVGRRLARAYKRLGVDLFEDCLNINAVNCRPPNNREPTDYEIACCRRKVLEVIEQHKPHVIVLLGNAAVKCLLGHRWKKDLGGITKWRGWTIPDRDFRAWVCPVWHPSYVERQGAEEVDNIWKKDLKRALSMVDAPLPSWEDDSKYVEIISTPTELKPSPMVAIDYETTGLKPHAPGHRVVCAAVAQGTHHVQVFMMPRTRAERKPFLQLLADGSVKKIAHNMKFEETWSAVRLRQPVNGWYWDTMLAAHILDNRSGITGLKFQVYVNFGVVDYDSSIAGYLKRGDGKDANAMNNLLQLCKSSEFRNKLMTYCGLDALYTYRLAMKQMESIEKGRLVQRRD